MRIKAQYQGDEHDPNIRCFLQTDYRLRVVKHPWPCGSTLHSRNALYARELPLPASLTIRSANSRVSHASWPCASRLAPPWPTLPGRSRTPLPNRPNTASNAPPHHALRDRRCKRRISSLDHASSFAILLAPRPPLTRSQFPAPGVTLPSPARQ